MFQKNNTKANPSAAISQLTVILNLLKAQILLKASLTSGSETSKKAPIQGVCLPLVIDSLKTPDIFSQPQPHSL